MSTARILIIEDERPMRTVLADCLTAEGYRTLTAADGAAGLKKAVHEQPDLILLDLMMPKLDGFSVCAELRRLGKTTPILVLTAKGQLDDRVRGLDLGADDYLVKPFSIRELLARVRALLRRFERARKELHAVTLGAVRVDFVRQLAWRDQQALHFTAKELAMLRLLAEADGAVVSREKFLDVVWGCDAYPSSRTVDTHIAGLRAKIEADPENPCWIKTAFGVGYRMDGVSAS